MLASLRTFLFGPPNYAELKRSSDERFEQLRRELFEERAVQYVPTKEEVFSQSAEEVDFESVFGLLTDDRLTRMARTFIKWNVGERYDISFAAYVKAVASGRWREFVEDDHKEPPSTILSKYKLKHYYFKMERQQRHSVQTTTVIFGSFVAVVLIVVWSFN